MNPPFHLRPPRLQETKALAALGRETFTETFGHLYHPDDLNAHLTKNYGDDLILAELTNPDLQYQVIEQNSELIAFIKIGPLALPVNDPPPGAMEIRQLYVRQAFASQGLGKALMTWAFEQFETTHIYLSVFSENDRAIRFYQNYSFTKCGEYHYPVGKHLDLEWIMQMNPNHPGRATF